MHIQCASGLNGPSVYFWNWLPPQAVAGTTLDATWQEVPEDPFGSIAAAAATNIAVTSAYIPRKSRGSRRAPRSFRSVRSS
jgi:hypothetical protein